MLLELDRILKRLMPLITPTSVVIGVLLGSHLSGFSYLAPWIFAFMTLVGSLGSGFKEFLHVLSQPGPLIATLFVLHLVMPLLAASAGHIVYGDNPNLMVGLLLAAAIPTGITSLIWVVIYRGNAALTISIILIDTLLSPFVVPFTLSLLAGAKVEMDIAAMMEGLFYMIVLPSLVGMALNQWTRGRVRETWVPVLSPLSKIGIGVIVAINASVVAPYLRDFDAGMLGLAALVLFLAASGYAIGWLVARLVGWKRDIVVALAFNSGMRNISAGAVLAISYFAPPVAIPVVLGMLFQQSLASLCGYLLNRAKPE